MNTYYLHFTNMPEVETLRTLVARHFEVKPASVFIYSDALKLFGSATQQADEHQLAQYYASVVRVMVRPYRIGSGPLAGWLSVETVVVPLREARALAHLLAVETRSCFFYNDPVRDPDDPNGGDAQIEIAPDGAERKVWVIEYGDESGSTLTVIDERGLD